MNKILTYYNYFNEYWKYRDFTSITASFKYLLLGKSHRKDRVIQTSIGKFFCRANTNDFQFANYRYEWGVKKFILDRIGEYSVFIDGGACIGEYSVMLARHNIRCYAFEPVSSNYKALLKNLELNELSHSVKAFPFGLGDQQMKAGYVFNPVNTGASYIDKGKTLNGHVANIRTFDSFIPELNLGKDEKILVKLDVEGMEPEVIRGASEFIKSYNNITFIMEDKHVGKDSIWKTLNKIAPFEFSIVDSYNICAKKINNNPNRTIKQK